MIIDNGKIQYYVAEAGSPYGRDEHGNLVVDDLVAQEPVTCNMQAKARTYFSGDATQTFTAAVYDIIVEHRPPAGTIYALLSEVDGTPVGEVKIENIEPLAAVSAYRITAHANKR